MRRPLQSSKDPMYDYACYVFLSKRISTLHVTSGQTSSVIRMERLEARLVQVTVFGRAQCGDVFRKRR